jgi:hypothetical protein
MNYLLSTLTLILALPFLMESNDREGIETAQPKSERERTAVAARSARSISEGVSRGADATPLAFANAWGW